MNTYQPVNNHDDLLKVVEGLLGEAGLELEGLGGKMTFAGMDPIRPTGLKVGSAAAAITGANAVASSLIWKMRSSRARTSTSTSEKPTSTIAPGRIRSRSAR